MSTTQQINGPLNIIRLDNPSLSKVIYLFLDVHLSLKNQTQCKSVFAQDITKYLLNTFIDMHDANRKCDFFLEILPSEVHSHTDYTATDIYIEQVLKLFKYMVHAKNNTTSTIATSPLVKNVRLHYMDIREYFADDIDFCIDSIMKNLSDKSAVNNKKLLRIAKAYTNLITYLESIRAEDATSLTQDQLSVIRKIRYTYNYEANEAVINHKWNTIVKPRIKFIIAKITSATKSITQVIESNGAQLTTLIKNKYAKKHEYTYEYGFINLDMHLRDFKNDFDYIDQQITYLMTYITDLYFFRRFIDKDYVTNAVVYVGANHTFNYIDLLVKDYGFVISHCANNKGSSMRELTSFAKNNALTSYGKVFLPDELLQCSTITGFPKQFS